MRWLVVVVLFGCDASSTEAPPSARCPQFGEPRAIATLGAADLTEASGLVASHMTPGVLWSVNDSGHAPRLYALRSDGSPVATVDVHGATLVDWEDLAIVGQTLYVGDIGDNALARKSIVVYRVDEPALSPPPTTVEATAYELTYEDGKPRDAEALLVDPLRAEVVIVTKDPAGASEVFAGALAPKTVLHHAGSLLVGQPPLESDPRITGGSVSADGKWVALRTYSSAFVWPRDPSHGLAQTLFESPCPVALASEVQGESIAFSPDARTIYTTSEGASAPLSASERE